MSGVEEGGVGDGDRGVRMCCGQDTPSNSVGRSSFLCSLEQRRQFI